MGELITWKFRFSLIVWWLHCTYNYDFLPCLEKCFNVIGQYKCTKSLTANISWSLPPQGIPTRLVWRFLHAGPIHNCSLGILPHQTVVYVEGLLNYNNKQHWVDYSDQSPVYSTVLTTVKHSINLNIHGLHYAYLHTCIIYSLLHDIIVTSLYWMDAQMFRTSCLTLEIRSKNYIEESEKLAAAGTWTQDTSHWQFQPDALGSIRSGCRLQYKSLLNESTVFIIATKG